MMKAMLWYQTVATALCLLNLYCKVHSRDY